MLFTKMNAIIDEVNELVAEREELVECIAICLLARKNLFILGDTGQAKSYAINEFRKRITGAKQFERLMSKQTDEEQLFGRLDLSSLIPGSLPQQELMQDEMYSELSQTVSALYEKYLAERNEEDLKKAADAASRLYGIKKILCSIKDSRPQMITEGKIPDSHIVFLDEIFKSGDGILNSLLTALNEKVYTNEGQTVKIPVISFFSASNEIPNFKDPVQAILKPLYDRFELKVLTEYVQEKDNRMKVLKDKQGSVAQSISAEITLLELEKMQQEVSRILVSDSINELMDNILCELRRNNIHVSDRKFFGFTPIVRAKAYLSGNREVVPKDLLVLKNYFWNTPQEIETVERILTELCENPVGSELSQLLAMAGEAKSVMDEVIGICEQEQCGDSEMIKPFVVFSKQLLDVYMQVQALRADDLNAFDTDAITKAEQELEEMLKQAAQRVNATYISLAEQKRLTI